MPVMEPILVSKVHGVEVDPCVKTLQEIRRKGDGVRPRSIRPTSSTPKEAMRSFIMYTYITPESEQTYQNLVV